MPQVAPNSPSARFGGKGQLAIMSEAGVLFTHTTIADSDVSSTAITFRPAVDYFIIDHLSLGAFTGIEYTKASGSSTTGYGIGPRLGYSIPFSERFSVWPKAGVSYNSSTVKIDGIDVGGVSTPSVSDTNSAMALNVFVPILFHANHYFVGFGPSLDTALTGDNKATTIAVRLTVGGWVF